MLQIQQVTKVFNPGTVNEKIALNHINLHLSPGDFVCVIGTNGAGKSTLMNAIAGTFPVDHGHILIDKQDVTRLQEYQRASLVGRVFQDPMAGTAPSMSIEENMAIAYRRGQKRGLRMASNRRLREKFREALTQLELGLENRLQSKVGLLSGGERQALSLLMATFTEPKILLLDEHTAALDPKRAQLIIELTQKIVNKYHLTTLMITHNMEHALRMGNRLIMMHEGEIILDLSKEEKEKMTVRDLIDAFERGRGEAFVDDRVVLT
ncbi:ABC transporter ATP-binding protein [Microaerobacter geothermalis]|uniref:ABC transporter ATP-binding protein n=1 Tax=Microaerobacter geothermalis TaxID=674972 RepID=UPI001F2A2031|nr:ABC transporter ATP-binding protein [Microaerobacter geothermalis]MCF6093661.1 ABC transporter ATP-binding protein [Microaerobacter geothermalis]